MMDLSNFMGGYICGVMNVVVYLQWAQVYKVISDPNIANQTFLTNWAVKMECAFVMVFTLIMVACIYTSMLDHFDKKDDTDDALDVTKTTLHVVNSVIRLVVIILYCRLLHNFRKLIKE